MALRDLDQLGLLLPRKHWGHRPRASLRTTVFTVLASLLGLAAAAMIWFGQGGTLTFVGLGLFLMDLGLFLVVTFWAVEHRMEALAEIGADGPTVQRDPD